MDSMNLFHFRDILEVKSYLKESRDSLKYPEASLCFFFNLILHLIGFIKIFINFVTITNL